jgi:hypothetical protein
MGLVIDCECGVSVRGESEEGLVAAAEAHIDAEHPAAASATSREDLLAMAYRDEEDA